MSKLTDTIKHEFREVLPPTIFFFAAFNIIAVTRVLMLNRYGIEADSFIAATVGALVVGKVVLLADKLRLINRFPDKPLIYNVVWKTAVYVIAAFFVRYAEHLLPLVGEYGGIASASSHLLAELEWPRFWAIQIWLSVLLFVYTSFRELTRVVGREAIMSMFFGMPVSDSAE